MRSDKEDDKFNFRVVEFEVLIFRQKCQAERWKHNYSESQAPVSSLSDFIGFTGECE